MFGVTLFPPGAGGRPEVGVGKFEIEAMNAQNCLSPLFLGVNPRLCLAVSFIFFNFRMFHIYKN